MSNKLVRTCLSPLSGPFPQLEPVHRVRVENLRMRWNETNRNLVYAMMNMYNHARALKKNLSAQALKAISLTPPITAAAATHHE